MTIRLLQPRHAAEWQTARALVEEYGRSLQMDLEFQNFRHEVEHLAAEYAPPAGAFLVAEEAGVALGCAALWRMTIGSGVMNSARSTVLTSRLL